MEKVHEEWMTKSSERMSSGFDVRAAETVSCPQGLQEFRIPAPWLCGGPPAPALHRPRPGWSLGGSGGPRLSMPVFPDLGRSPRHKSRSRKKRIRVSCSRCWFVSCGSHRWFAGEALRSASGYGSLSDGRGRRASIGAGSMLSPGVDARSILRRAAAAVSGRGAAEAATKPSVSLPDREKSREIKPMKIMAR